MSDGNGMQCRIIQGDALESLLDMDSESVQCCVTSPPYWGLRDYGVVGQMGLERTPEEYVNRMVEVFREVRRVLRDDGTLWLNLGDSYWGGGNYRGINSTNTLSSKQASNRGATGVCQELGAVGKTTSWGLKPKDLVGIPWRVAFALQADGWWLRQDIIWHKPNPMPESVTDRCTKAHEYLFLLTKQARYYYDAEAIKEPAIEGLDLGLLRGKRDVGLEDGVSWHAPSIAKRQLEGIDSRSAGNGTRNKRSVWTVNPQPYSEAHFATFPPDLIKPCILAGTSARGCCPKCGAPVGRVVETNNPSREDNTGEDMTGGAAKTGNPQTSKGLHRNNGGVYSSSKTIGWQTTCECGETGIVPCTVLDPFAGSGTTGMVALELGRKAVLIELNPKYVELINTRTFVTPGLPLSV